MNYDPIQARFQILYSTRHVYQNLTTVSGQTRKCWDKVDILTIAPMDMYFQLQLVTVCLYFIFNCPIFSDTWAYCSSSSSLLMADRYFFGLDDRDTTQTIKQIFKIELRHSKLERCCEAGAWRYWRSIFFSFLEDQNLFCLKSTSCGARSKTFYLIYTNGLLWFIYTRSKILGNLLRISTTKNSRSSRSSFRSQRICLSWKSIMSGLKFYCF